MFAKFAAVAAFAVAALAQVQGFSAITAPGEGATLQAGSSYTIKWLYNAKPEWAGPVSITLLGGQTPSTLVSKQVLATNYDQSKGQFVWAIDAALGADATYGIEIALASKPAILQYSFPFKIQAGSGGSSSKPGSGTHSGAPTGTDSASASETTYPHRRPTKDSHHGSASVSASDCVSETECATVSETESTTVKPTAKPTTAPTKTGHSYATTTAVVKAQPTYPAGVETPHQVAGAGTLAVGSLMVVAAAVFAL